MSEQSKPLLVVNSTNPLSEVQAELLRSQLLPFTEQLGLHLLVVSEDIRVGIHSDLRPLIERQLAEQLRTNDLLESLVLALSEGDDNHDYSETEPVYLSEPAL